MATALAGSALAGSSPTGNFQRDFEHTGPGTVGGRYLRTFWQPIALSQEVAVGRARPVKVMCEKLTLYRGKSGKVHLVAAKCPHRAAQLSAGWVEGDCIRCQYHGWMFDGSGQCVEQPGEEKGYAAKIQMPAYEVREHVGLVWAYMGEGAPPPFPPFPDFEGEGIDENYYEIFPSNYLTNMENDTYHGYWTHRPSGLVQRLLGKENALLEAYSYELPEVKETDYGVEIRKHVGEGRVGTQVYVNPCGVLFLPGPAPDYLFRSGVGSGPRPSFVSKLAIDDETHYWMWAQRVQLKPDEVEPYRKRHEEYLKLQAENRPPVEVARDILDGKLTWDDVTDYPFLVAVEDLASQMGQGALAGRPPERLGRTDGDLIFRRRVYERELKSLAEGRPLKPWKPITDWEQVPHMIKGPAKM